MTLRKKRLYIVSGGAFGRELIEWILQTRKFLSQYSVQGILHDEPDETTRAGIQRTGFPLLGSWKTFDFPSSAHVLNPTGSSEYRRLVNDTIRDRVSYATFIHSSCIIGRRVEIGAGSMICPNCVLTTDIEVGKNVLLNNGTQIGHDARIGDYVSIMAQVEIGGGVTIEPDAFIGSSAVVHPQVTVERGAKVGIGSVVIKRVHANDVVFGNPAKKIN